MAKIWPSYTRLGFLSNFSKNILFILIPLCLGLIFRHHYFDYHCGSPQQQPEFSSISKPSISLFSVGKVTVGNYYDLFTNHLAPIFHLDQFVSDAPTVGQLPTVDVDFLFGNNIPFLTKHRFSNFTDPSYLQQCELSDIYNFSTTASNF